MFILYVLSVRILAYVTLSSSQGKTFSLLNVWQSTELHRYFFSLLHLELQENTCIFFICQSIFVRYVNHHDVLDNFERLSNWVPEFTT